MESEQMQPVENEKATEKKSAPRFPFWKRLLIFLLGMFVGLVACVGGIAGAGYWAYANLSADRLGVALPAPLQGTGEVDIGSYTVKDLVGDILYYTDPANKGALTLSNLEARYGLQLLADVNGMLPEELTELALSELSGEGALGKILSCLDFNFIFSFLEEGAISPALADALGDRDISALAGGDLAALMEGVKLGYLMGLEYEKQGEDWVLVSQEGFLSILAGMEVGPMIDASMNGGDMLGVMRDSMGDATLADLMGGGDGAEWLASIKMADVIVYSEEDGKYRFDMLSAMGTVLLGEIMGYEKSGETWYDGEAAVVGVAASVADMPLKDILEGALDVNDVFGEMYLGEVMGYEIASYKEDGVTPKTWKDSNGALVEGFDADIANIKVGALTDGEGVDFEEVFGDQQVGELQGYEKRADGWYNQSGQPLDALDSSIASIYVGDLIDGTVDLSETFRDAKVSSLLGYKKQANGTWVDENGQKVTDVLALLADVKLGEMNSTVSSWKLGNIMGYELVGGVWTNPAGKTNSMMSQVANLSINDVSNPDAVHAAVDGMRMSDIFGYEKGADGKWYHGATKVTGVMSYLADHKVSELAYEVEHMAVHDILGYKQVGNKWVHEDGSDICPLMAAIANATINELDETVSNLTLAQLFEGTDDGFFSLLGGSTKISQLDARVEQLFDANNGATIGDFMDAGLIDDVDATQDAKLRKYVGNDWRDRTVTSFISTVVDVIAMLP